eukprot:6485792-Amphidinium_carterae.2
MVHSRSILSTRYGGGKLRPNSSPVVDSCHAAAAEPTDAPDNVRDAAACVCQKHKTEEGRPQVDWADSKWRSATAPARWTAPGRTRARSRRCPHRQPQREAAHQTKSAQSPEHEYGC